MCINQQISVQKYLKIDKYFQKKLEKVPDKIRAKRFIQVITTTLIKFLPNYLSLNN